MVVGGLGPGPPAPPFLKQALYFSCVHIGLSQTFCSYFYHIVHHSCVLSRLLINVYDEVNCVWTCGAAEISFKDVVWSSETQTMLDSRLSVRRHLFEGYLDSLPSVQNRVVRLFISTTYSGQLQVLSCLVLLCFR